MLDGSSVLSPFAMQFLFQFFDLLLKLAADVDERIHRLPMIGPGDPLSVQLDHSANTADNSAVGGNFLQDDRVRPDLRIVAYPDRSDNLRAGADHDAVADRRVTLSFLLAAAAKRHVVEKHNIVADLAGLSDDDTHPVIDKQPAADLRPWVNLDARKESVRLRNDSGNHKQPVPEKPMGDSMAPDGVQTGIGKDDLQHAAGGRIVIEDSLNIGFYRTKHGVPSPHSKKLNKNHKVQLKIE
jgi:hypothetical protein